MTIWNYSKLKRESYNITLIQMTSAKVRGLVHTTPEKSEGVQLHLFNLTSFLLN